MNNRKRVVLVMLHLFDMHFGWRGHVQRCFVEICLMLLYLLALFELHIVRRGQLDLRWGVIFATETALTSILRHFSDGHRTTNVFLSVLKVGIRCSYAWIIQLHYISKRIDGWRHSRLEHGIDSSSSWLLRACFLKRKLSLLVLESLNVAHDLVDLLLNCLEIVRYLFLSWSLDQISA